MSKKPRSTFRSRGKHAPKHRVNAEPVSPEEMLKTLRAARNRAAGMPAEADAFLDGLRFAHPPEEKTLADEVREAQRAAYYHQEEVSGEADKKNLWYHFLPDDSVYHTDAKADQDHQIMELTHHFEPPVIRARTVRVSPPWDY